MPHRLLRLTNDWKMSLRWRLTVWVVSIFVVIQFLTGLAFWSYQSTSVRQQYLARLGDRAVAIASEIESQFHAMNAVTLRDIVLKQLAFFRFDPFRVDLVRPDGSSVVYESPRWPLIGPELARHAAEGGSGARPSVRNSAFTLNLPEGEGWEAVAVPTRAANEPVYIILAASSEPIVRQMRLVTQVLVVGGVLGILASSLSGWYIAGIAVAPLRYLTNVAEQLTPENLHRKLKVDDAAIREVAALTDELEAARARLREAFATQERFLSNVSHELKTPIATLLTEAQTLPRSDLSPAAKDFTETVEEEMRKLGRLIESFLTLTRINDGSGINKLRRYPANELVLDAVEDCTPMSRQYAVRIDTQLAGSEDALDAEVLGDPDLLRTMLNNLIHNAIRFAPRGSRVAVSAAVSHRVLSVVVRDKGSGIADDLLDRVFDRHAQSPDEVRRERGHGLGLAIAKGIAELHKGDITVRNHQEGGAEFTAVLPVRSRMGDSPPVRDANKAALVD